MFGIGLVKVVHTKPEEFENGGFTLKTHQMFPVNTIRRRHLKTLQLQAAQPLEYTREHGHNKDPVEPTGYMLEVPANEKKRT